MQCKERARTSPKGYWRPHIVKRLKLPASIGLCRRVRRLAFKLSRNWSKPRCLLLGRTMAEHANVACGFRPEAAASASRASAAW